MTDHDDAVKITDWHAGWAEPSANLYPVLPEVTVTRGGINFTEAPVANLRASNSNLLSRLARLKAKNRKLRARLDIALDTNRIHTEARRTLVKEARALRKTIEQLRSGGSIAPRKTVPGCTRVCCNPGDSGIAIGHDAFTEPDEPQTFNGEPVVPQPRGPQYYGSWIDETYRLDPDQPAPDLDPEQHFGNEHEAWTEVEINGHRGSVPASMVVDLDTLGGLVTPGFPTDLPRTEINAPDGEG